MRYSIVVAAVVGLWVQPTEAATFLISGTAEGTINDLEPCEVGGGPNGLCNIFVPYTHGFSFTVSEPYDPLGGGVSGGPDAYGFQTGTLGSGLYEGEFRRVGPGQFTGELLSYNLIDFTCISATTEFPPGCIVEASTSRFSVTQIEPIPNAPVPEPSTWAMMLLGFGFVGSAMRSAGLRQKLAVSYA